MPVAYVLYVYHKDDLLDIGQQVQVSSNRPPGEPG